MYGTPQDVINMTGIKPETFGLDEQPNPDVALNTLLTTWLTNISAAINVRLNRSEIQTTDPIYPAISDICVRTVCKLVSVAIQQRTTPIVQVSEFAVTIINTSQVTQDLYKELFPFQKRNINIFSSIKPVNPNNIKYYTP